MKTLKFGYELPFLENPSKYEERNNKSARDNEEKVREIVFEMIDLGIVEQVDRKPFCINPLGLVTKVKDGKTKFRLVWDASRHLNIILEKQKVKLMHLEKALEITSLNDFQAVFDLKSAYYHIKIREDQSHFLGASITDAKGCPIFFKYLHLPFGLSSAVHVITKLWKPLVAYFTQKKIRFSIYIDDGRIVASSREEAEQALEFVYDTIAKAGWTLEKEKSDTKEEISQVKDYLGFQIDTRSMRVFATPEKMTRMKELLQETLRCEQISVKALARVLGKMISLRPSHGSSVLICSKSSYVCLEEAVAKDGWRSRNECILSQEAKSELRFFLDNLHKLNGHFIQTEARAIRVDSILPNPITNCKYIPFIGGSIDKVMVSDASETKIFAYSLSDDCNHQFSVSISLSGEERKLSSGHRELLAVLKTLQTWKATRCSTNMKVFWITDSTNVVAFINKGSNKAHIQKSIFEIVLLMRDLDLEIVPIHLKREDPRVQLADQGSKRKDSDNWSIDNKSFKELHEVFHFEFDLFADSYNRKMKNYASLYYDPNSKLIDAFSANWGDLGMLWICPPIKDLIRVAKRIRSTSCRGVVIIPIWPSSSFYHFFLINHSSSRQPFILERCMKPYIHQNENARNTPLFGVTNFEFAILSFDTTQQSAFS